MLVLNIEQFRYMLAVAKHQNFTEASYEVFLSQSSLSKQIRNLEKELGGIRLFERNSRNVHLTAAGEEFVKHCDRFIQDFESMQSAMHAYTTLERGHLKLGTLLLSGQLGLTSIIADFKRKYPGIALEIKEKPTKELLELLHQGEIDVAYVTAPDHSTDKNLILYPLIEDETFLVVHKLHSLAKKRSISLLEAAKEPFIFVDPALGSYKSCLEACVKAGFKPNIIYQSPQIDTILGLVAERMGVAMLTSRTVGSFPNVKLVRLNETIRRTTALAILRKTESLGSTKAFVKHTLEWKKTHAMD